MKLNTTLRHYMPLPQNQSDDEETSSKKSDKLMLKNGFCTSETLYKKDKNEEVKVINAKDTPMSTIRLAAFIFSLVLCVLFVVIFVYCVPCTVSQNINGLCRLTHKYRAIIPNTSFSSLIDLVDNIKSYSHTLLVGYTGVQSGILAMDKSDGRELWRFPLHATLFSPLCHKIDVNSDGISECIIAGEEGLLVAVDVTKGTPVWYLHNHGNISYPDSIGIPRIIPDCDGDKVADLLVPYNLLQNNVSYLAIVSGSTGEIIGYLVELTQCCGSASFQFSWNSSNDTEIILYCKGEKHGNLWHLSSNNICRAAFSGDQTLKVHNMFRIPYMIEEVQFYEISDTPGGIIISLDGIKFIFLEKASPGKFHIKWQKYMESDLPMRILTSGQFTNASMQLVLAGSNSHHSKVIGINLIDGIEVFSLVENTTVVSAIKIQNFFYNFDGLILKTVSTDYTSFSNMYEYAPAHSIGNSDRKRIKHFQERYILVKCEKYPVTKTLIDEGLLAIKEKRKYRPNLYTPNSTVIVHPEEKSAFELLTVSSTVRPPDYRSEIIIQYFNIRNIPTLSRCSTEVF